jgi:hypothetical protein
VSRRDLYARPHKALRALMADTLVAIGRADPREECEVRDAHARLEEMLASCEKHAALENEFVHRALDAREDGAACRLAVEHLEHAQAIDELRAAARERRPDLYRRVAAFVGANLRHMDEEERHGNALLWRLFTDAELEAIESRLVASIPPGEKMQSLRWMLPALSHPERVELLQGLRHAPPAVYEGALALARMHLAAADFDRLAQSAVFRQGTADAGTTPVAA